MENFDPKPNSVKEKNLYIVHLDTPRIVILSSVVIGIVAASFLFGMSFIKDNNLPVKNLAVNDINLDSNDEDLFGKENSETVKGGLDDLKIDESSELVGTDKLDDTSKGLAEEKGSDLAKNDKVIKTEEKVDVLTKENIKEIIQPDFSKKIKASSKKSIAKNKSPKKQNKRVKIAAVKRTEKKVVRKSVKKSRVVPVSRQVSTPRNNNGFSVQVASYDKQFKAENEKNRLKSKRYDAYVDRTIVNGRNYYRVKVGPVSSRNSAASLLNGIQRDSRYSNSYITKD